MYADGAYTAVPDLSPTWTGGNGIDEEDVDPQESYYVSLGDRFAALRADSQHATHIANIIPSKTGGGDAWARST